MSALLNLQNTITFKTYNKNANRTFIVFERERKRYGCVTVNIPRRHGVINPWQNIYPRAPTPLTTVVTVCRKLIVSTSDDIDKTCSRLRKASVRLPSDRLPVPTAVASRRSDVRELSRLSCRPRGGGVPIRFGGRRSRKAGQKWIPKAPPRRRVDGDRTTRPLAAESVAVSRKTVTVGRRLRRARASFR